MRTIRIPILLMLALLAAAPVLAYTVILKDGSRIISREEPTIEGTKAIIILQNGTRTSIEASEIDFEQTRGANTGNYGSAEVIDDGTMTEIPSSTKAPKRETLADLIAKRGDSTTSRPPPPRTQRQAPPRAAQGTLDFQNLQRRPFNDLEAASQVRQLFRGQGVDEILIYQGSESDHLLLEVVTNSEASVFRSLEAAGRVLLALGEAGASVTAFEVVLTTSEREPAGQFLFTEQEARLLADNQMEVSAFFVDQVRF